MIFNSISAGAATLIAVLSPGSRAVIAGMCLASPGSRRGRSFFF